MKKFIGFYNSDIQLKQRLMLADLGFSELYRSNKIQLMSNDAREEVKIRFSQENELVLLLLGDILNMDDPRKSREVFTPSPKNLSRIFTGYREKGVAFLDELDGNFCMGLWDEQSQTLHLCRDDGGTKLLYYQRVGRGYVFSNDIESIIRVSGKKAISSKALVEYLRFLDISPPYTIFEGIYFLEPEMIMSLNSDGMSQREKIVNNRQADADHQSEDFETLFMEAVEKRIYLSSSSGVFLSGGIDSSLVCAAASHLRKDITAVTVGFDDPRFDESHIASEIAKHLGIDHETLIFSMDQDMQAFQDFTSTIASPFADPAIIPTFQCFKQLEGRMEKMLDGTGADTLIGIMPARYIHFILNFSMHLPLDVRKAVCRILSLFPRGRKHIDLFDFNDPAEVLIRWNGWNQYEIPELSKLEYSIAHTMFHKRFVKNLHKTPYEIYSSLMGALPDDRVNQTSALTGIDVSFPFLTGTYRIMSEICPWNQNIRKGDPKPFSESC